MRIARVIVTWKCDKDCDLCCNKNLPVQPQPCTIEDLQGYDQVLITGGEPMLYPARLEEIIKKLRAQAPENKVYLYSALYRPAMHHIVKLVDGIHYTLHHPFRQVDLDKFNRFHTMIDQYRDKSFRLYIDPRIDWVIPIRPDQWSRVEVKPWMDACPLPEGEVLLELKEYMV